MNQNHATFLTKDDKADFLSKIDVSSANTRSELLSKIAETRTELISKIEGTRLEIRDSKVDMLKWFFAFFVTQTLLIAGLYFKR